jgi:hypothetical protein
MKTLSAPRATPQPTPRDQRQRQDRLAHGLILAAGALCFLLLAWGHLGLGALLIPPPHTAAQQTQRAGRLTVALALDSGQLTAAGPNTVSFTLTDADGHAIIGAAAVAHPEMVTMAMEAPSVVATPGAPGSYTAHPRFAMAGDWRLVVTISRPGYGPQTLSFPVSVRWS